MTVYHRKHDSMGDSDRDQTSQSPTTENGTCVTSTDRDADNSGRLQLRFRLACLQFLASAQCFLFFMCSETFCRTMANGLLGATVSTLERRFALSSSKTAWIVAAYEIAGTPAPVIGYFGPKLRRPLWIGAGMFLFGIGVGIYTIPHFVAPAYRYEDSTDPGNLCSVDDIGQVSEWRNSSITSSRCSDDEVSDGNKYLAVFIVSIVLRGFGALPLYVLAVPCLYDVLPGGTASVYIGILPLISEYWTFPLDIFPDILPRTNFLDDQSNFEKTGIISHSKHI